MCLKGIEMDNLNYFRWLVPSFRQKHKDVCWTATPSRAAFLTAALTIMMLLFHGAVNAASPPGTHLEITGVAADSTAKKILILGQDFDFGPGPLVVSLANIGDITADCTTNFSASPQTISCDLSKGNPSFPSPGDYLLTVSTGNGTSQVSQWDLTIGAVGPQGPQGPQGPPGPPGITGLEGFSCPSGEFVSGFSSSGQVICSGGSTGGGGSPCTNHQYTFAMNSSAAGPFSDASWPGGTLSQSDPSNTKCSVTVNVPSGDVILIGTLGNAWSVASHPGYTSCTGVSGPGIPNGDGVANPNCSQLNQPSIPNVTSGRPSCSNGLCSPLICGGNGIASDTFTVTCVP